MFSDELYHYGIKGMHWGIRRTPEQLGHKKSYSAAEILSSSMKKLPYKNFTTLKSPEYTKRHGGFCHDQTFMELHELRKAGLKPKAMFLMEYNDDNQGGMTHSFAYYKKGRKTVWFENAWSDKAGLHEFNSAGDIKKAFKKAHKAGTWGNSKAYKHMVFTDFHEKDHKVGESLYDFVARCLG